LLWWRAWAAKRLFCIGIISGYYFYIILSLIFELLTDETKTIVIQFTAVWHLLFASDGANGDL